MRPPKPKRAPKALTREATIAELLADPWGILADGENHPLLASYAAEDRREIMREAERAQWAKRERVRRTALLERLESWDVSQWGRIFSERPDLEKELTPEQAAEWAAWLRRNFLAEPSMVRT